jgi:hypothetical protein
MQAMKTTLEIPDMIFRRATSKTAAQGVPLRQFVTEAVEDKLRSSPASGREPWMKHLGKLKDLHKERQRINRAIEEPFEVVDSEMWAPEDPHSRPKHPKLNDPVM